MRYKSSQGIFSLFRTVLKGLHSHLEDIKRCRILIFSLHIPCTLFTVIELWIPSGGLLQTNILWKEESHAFLFLPSRRDTQHLGRLHPAGALSLQEELQE